MSAVLPPQPPNIIDVDALEDDDVVFSGYTRTSLHPAGRRDLDEEGLVYMGFSRNRPASRRSHTTSSAHAGPSAGTRAEEVIVLDSDDEEGQTSSTTSGSSSKHLCGRFLCA